MSHAPRLPRDLLSWLDAPATWREAAPSLPSCVRTDFSIDGGAHDGGRDLPPEGFLVERRLIDESIVRETAQAINAVARAGLPPVFAYVYDAPWEIAAALVPVGRRYLDDVDVLADVWAFQVHPGTSGWPPHRGFIETTDRCTTLDAWVALSDADRETSCLWFVPLDQDPAFPSDLSSLNVPRDVAVPAPVQAGDALVWDARILHWGGPMAVHAAAPRMSVSFTLRSRARRKKELPVLDLQRLDLRARLDLIAHEVAKYQDVAKSAPEIMSWAQLTLEMIAVAPGR